MGKEVLIEMSKIEENNYNHTYIFRNNRNKLDFIKFIKEDFNVSQFLENDRGLQNPDKLNFTLEFRRRVDKVVNPQIPLKELKFDDYEPVRSGDFLNKIYSNEPFDSDIPVDVDVVITDIIKEGDYIELIDHQKGNVDNSYILYSGYVTSITYRYFNTNICFDLEVEDITYKGFDTKFDDDYFYQDKYIYNSADLDNSLLFILIKMMLKLSTNAEVLSKINIPNITYKDGSLRKILFCQWATDETIYQHIANLVDSFGGKIYMENGLLTVKNPLGVLFSNSYNNGIDNITPYEFNDDNILNSLKENTYTNYNEVDITYDQYEIAERQKIYQLMGVNGTEAEGNAKVSVDVNVNLVTNDNYFEVNFISDAVLDIESNFKTSGHYYTIEGDENSKVTLELVSGVHYTIDYTNTGGKLKFGNPLAYKLYIDTFIIYGKPIMVTSNNSYNYTRDEESIRSEQTYTISGNQYIQTLEDAQLLAKYLYFLYCTPTTEYIFDANLCSPLNINTLVQINHIDALCDLLITKCDYTSQKMAITANKLKIFVVEDYTGGINTNQNAVDYNIVKGLDYIKEDIITIDSTAPVAPMNLTLITNFNGFYAKWDEIPNREDIRGYYIYIKYTQNSVVSESISFTATTSKYIPVQYLVNSDNSIVNYEVKIKAVTFKGIEGYYSTSSFVIPLKTIDSSSQITYPVGMSPSDLNTKLTTANTNISTLQTNLNTNSTNINNLQNSLNNFNFTSLQGSISASQILANTITTNMISAGAITALKIASGTITSSQIATDTITANNIAVGAITANEIATGAITAEKIATSTIVAGNIASGAITTDHISAGAIVSNSIATGAITTEKIAVGSITAETIAVGAITVDHISGKKLEGLEIVSENVTQTERVYMNYGKVVHQKRNTISEEYKTYEQLIMHCSGEISCPLSWSQYIDLKEYNDKKAWSSLNLIYFVGNQYSLDSGIATSREIIKEWYNNDPTTQKVRFKVCGNANITTETSMVGKVLRTTSSIIIPSTSIVDFGISVTAHVATTYVGGSIGNIYNRSRTIVYVQFDNEVEQILIDIPQDTSVEKSGGTYAGLLMTKTSSLYRDLLTNVKTFKLRVESYYYFLQSGNTYYGEPTITFTGSYTTMNFVQDKLFDATVNWLAIGNS